MPLTPALKEAILAQVACGDEELRAALEDELDLIYDCQSDITCFPRLQYIYAQLGAIEYAQVFVRHKIDTATRQYSAVTNETYTSRSQRNTDGESTGTGRACQWSASTSSQFFRRDSTDDTVSFSESNLLRTAERTEDGYDRGFRNTSGSGFSFSRVIHTVDDNAGNSVSPNAGQERRNSSKSSSTFGGTQPLVPIAGTVWEPNFVTTSLDPPFVDIGGSPGPLITITPATNNEQLCPDIDPDEPNPVYCRGFGFPSVGQGYHGRFNFGLVVPGVNASITVSWEEGFNQRQYYSCTGSTLRGESTMFSRMDQLNVSRTTALPEDNRSGSGETSITVHLVRKYGTSTRRGTETIDAEDRQRHDATGIAHNESERNSKGQARTQRRSEQLTTGDTVSALRRTTSIRDDEVRRSYGQISTHLAQLWKRIWANLETLERQFGSVPAAGRLKPPVCSLGCNGCFDVSFLSRYHRQRPESLSLYS